MKINWKDILYFAGVLLLLFFLIKIISSKPSIPSEYQVKIDSLQKQNINLNNFIKKLDSVNTIYYDSIFKLNIKMNEISKENLVIKHEYHEKIISVDKYNVSQLDSFFTKRYGQ